MKKILLLVLALWVALQEIQAQTGKSAAKVALENEIGALKKDPALLHAAWGLYVYNITTAQTEVEYNSQMSLMPASVMKILTTSTALAQLGDDFRFETKLQYTGRIDSLSGVLYGDLYLTGGGDPTLGSKRFDARVNADSVFSTFARTLLKAGIHRIEGKLLGDESIFDDMIPQTWIYEDIGNYYAGPVCGLAINDNMYRLYFDAGPAVGDSAKLTAAEPAIPGLTFINMVRTARTGTGDQVYILGNPYTNLRILDGTIPLGKTHFDVDGALPDPAGFCVKRFEEVLNQNGITVTKGTSTLRQERWNGRPDTSHISSRKSLSVHRSPTLSQIIYYTNTKSINMFAEHILKMLGAQKGTEGSTAQGIEVVRRYWASRGIDLQGFEMCDGSGLSRKNKITAQQLGSMLAVIFNEKSYSSFNASLPVAGKNGGIGSLLKGTAAENNLRAKTGTMDDVRAYAGYVKNISGEDLAFAILINNFTIPGPEMKKKCERIMQLIAELD